MIGSASNLKTFLDQVDAATKETSRSVSTSSCSPLRRSASQDSQRSPTLMSRYWAEQYRKATYDFDAQSVRPYFPYAQVEAGILATASKLFHVSFQRVPDAIVWDKSVTTYDVLDGGKRIGRIYLDMHPRDGQGQVVLVRAGRPGYSRTADAGGHADLQLLRWCCGRSRADGVRRGRHLLPRVRTPDAPHSRQPERVVAAGRLQCRGRLRRSAVADARGDVPQLRRAGAVRQGLQDRRDDPRVAGGEDERRRSLRPRELGAGAALLFDLFAAGARSAGSAVELR